MQLSRAISIENITRAHAYRDVCDNKAYLWSSRDLGERYGLNKRASERRSGEYRFLLSIP